MIRIKDIAQKAGVSPTTVSNVIHGNTKKVSAKTIEKIQSLLEEYSYVPSMGARMLAGRSSRIIGVLIGGKRLQKGSVESDAFTNILIRSLEAEIYKQDYYMLLHFSGSPEETLQFAAAWNVEGLITIGISPEDNLEISHNCHVPLVSIDVYYYEAEQLPNVGLDDYYGGYLMTTYLLQQGHRHILFLSDNDIGVDHERWGGFADAFRETGHPVDNSRHLLIPGEKTARSLYYQKCLPKIASSCDALFFASDYYAMEAAACLSDYGFHIPEDISLAGFDDNECAQLCRPQLTTIHQDVEMKAIVANAKLFSLIRKESEIPLTDKIPVKLVIRDSVRTI